MITHFGVCVIKKTEITMIRPQIKSPLAYMESQSEIKNTPVSSPNLETKETVEPSKTSLPSETKEPTEQEKETMKKLEETKAFLVVAYSQGAQNHDLILNSVSGICDCLVSDASDDEKVKELKKLLLKQKTTKNFENIAKNPHDFLTPAHTAYLHDNIEMCMISVSRFADETEKFDYQMKEIANILRSDSSAEKKVEKISDLLL